MKKKPADRAAMEKLEAMDVTATGEDPELLDPAEEAMLQGGNAVESHRRQDSDAAQAAQETGAGGSQSNPQEIGERDADAAAHGQNAERDDLSDEQVRKLGPNDNVPAWSLLKERQENRELKRKLEELGRKTSEHEERWNRASERLRQLQERASLEAVSAQRQASDPEPDPKADPNGHYQWELRQHRRALEALGQQQQASAAQAQAAQHNALLNGLEQQFILAGHHDYYDRLNFLRQRRNHELELMGYAEPAERGQIIGNETAMLVAGALRQGRNPAEVAHALSEQWGYRAPGALDTEGRGAGNAADKIRDLQRKQAAAQSLQAIASRPADAPVTLEDIAEMDDEAYERYVEKNGGDLAALFRRG